MKSFLALFIVIASVSATPDWNNFENQECYYEEACE